MADNNKKTGNSYVHHHSQLYAKYDPHGCGKCRKCKEQFSADPHGKDCSYNPIAFPPSMEVRCGECRRPTWQGLFLQSYCISSIHGGQMWEAGKMQVAIFSKCMERFSAGHQEYNHRH